ncbi:extracellular solute-binding protein [Gryllotalpicola protaetiae]|uniref:Sugar ABC transporter substrate-binding protein n=1 Tax=Gryllotalpicola protaetiae TaxID=2419771 RepID=A0A387BHX6_9MICO|nr:extracellular solute-binding protein [Gryllotalpicola protaetiae]AYG02278.1 sugar ABC transporter substrate-binding protein [Gryllotalpicola protaetiae]
MAKASGLTRRGFLAAGLAGLAVPALAGCAGPVTAGLAGSQLNPKTLIYWNLFGGGDGSRMQTMEAGYQKTHGGASSLQSTTFAWGNPYYSKVTLSTVGHKPPDVAISHLTRAKPLWEGGILDPITEDDLALVGLSPSDFSQAPWKAQITDGHNIAIPLDTHPLVMFYNVDVISKAGLLGSNGQIVKLDSMDTFEAALAAISKVTKGPAITSANVAGETATPWRVFTTLYNQHTGATPFLSDNGAKLTVDWDIFEDVTSRIQSWVKKGWLNSGLDYGTAQSYMFTGKAGLYLEGEWELTTAQLVKGLKFDMAPVPTLYDKPAAQADSHTFILPKKDRTPEQKKQAMGFIKSMLDQSMTWAQGGHVPAYLPVQTSGAYKKLVPQAHYASAADHAVYDDPAWYGGSGSTFEGIVGAELGLVQQGVATPAAARESITSQLKIYLNTPSPL